MMLFAKNMSSHFSAFFDTRGSLLLILCKFTSFEYLLSVCIIGNVSRQCLAYDMIIFFEKTKILGLTLLGKVATIPPYLIHCLGHWPAYSYDQHIFHMYAPQDIVKLFECF